MDLFAFQAANALVDNPTECAVIEMGLGDAVFQALEDCVVAVTGAGCTLSIYIWDFPLWSSFYVRAGWNIRLSRADGGMWAYLAVAGGFLTQPVLGSRATYLRGAFGGLEGRPLQAGDILKTGLPGTSSYELAARTLPEEARPRYLDPAIIDVIMGPQTSYFSEESIERFLSGAYFVSSTSDRMGYRLAGPSLTHRNGTELISEGMTFGAIQVPANGQPIVMMADGPPTGGYPKIGAVASADLPLFAQCVPNQSRIRFRETTVTKAQEKYRALIKGLDEIADDA
jgi:antagonist of KipI